MRLVPKLGLGTVQWGMRYGIGRHRSVPSESTVRQILVEARRHGATLLDTAAAYGKAEEVLGANCLDTFRVVTKTPRFATDTISDYQANELSQTFHRSLARLGSKNVYGLLIHHADDLLVPGGEKLIAAMTDLKERGLIDRIGVSIYEPRQIDALLDRFLLDVVQLPINVFDQRLLSGGQLQRLKLHGVEVHARSVFLQGLLLMQSTEIPNYFQPIQTLLARWRRAVEEQGLTLVQAALAFVRDLPEIEVGLVGVENLLQFQQCANDFCLGRRFNAGHLACDDPAFVDPARWQKLT